MHVVIHSLSHVQLFVTPCIAECQASWSITISWSLFKLMSTEPVMPSNHLILCRPLLLLPLIFPSIRVFSNESDLHIMRPLYWSFSFSISPSNEYSGLISFRMDWLDLLAVQGTLKSLLQHHSSKALILRSSATGSLKKQENSRKTSISILLTMTVWITINWKILKELEIPDHLTCLLRNLYAGQEATVELDMEQQTGSK